MPVKACREKDKPGYKYGDSGKCYTYTQGDETGRKEAKEKAYLQGSAIEAESGKKYSYDPEKVASGEEWIELIEAGVYPQFIKGRWVKHELTPKMVDDVAENYNPDKFLAGVNKYSHNNKQRYGDVIELKSENNILWGKTVIKDEITKQELTDGQLPYRSPGVLIRDGKIELEHLTFLGTDRPKQRGQERVGNYSYSYEDDGKELMVYNNYGGEELDKDEIADSVGERVIEWFKDKLNFSTAGGEELKKDEDVVTRLEFSAVEKDRDEWKDKHDKLEEKDQEREAKVERDAIIATYSAEMEKLKGVKYPQDKYEAHLEFAGKSELDNPNLKAVLEREVLVFQEMPEIVETDTEKVEGAEAPKPYDLTDQDGANQLQADAEAMVAKKEAKDLDEARIKLTKE